jgi:hypothetical protein
MLVPHPPCKALKSPAIGFDEVAQISLHLAEFIPEINATWVRSEFLPAATKSGKAPASEYSLNYNRLVRTVSRFAKAQQQ